MQILLVSDLHYTLKQLDWVASVAGDFDLVVVAGDHLDIASIVEPDAQIAVVLEYLSRMAAKTDGRRVLGQPRPQRAQRARRARRARGSTRRATPACLVDGTRSDDRRRVVTVCPWWDGPRTARASSTGSSPPTPRLVGDRQWIWVYHAPPDASPTSWTGKRHYGDEDLVGVDRAAPARASCSADTCTSRRSRPTASWIDRDRLDDWSSTPAARSGPMPTRIELDTDAGRARWSSLAGRRGAVVRAGSSTRARDRVPSRAGCA